MIKSLVFLSALLLSSAWSVLAATTLPAAAEPAASSGSGSSRALPIRGPSHRVRRAAAAGVPPEERKLQQQAPTCYLTTTPYPLPTPCDGLSCPVSVCCPNEAACVQEAGKSCEIDGSFKVSNPKQDCAWQYSCCAYE